MKIAVLSGKGGAGKTLVAVNLAASVQEAVYVDCDVEEPNGQLFLKAEHPEKHMVYKKLPVFDAEKCTGCRACVDFCRFHALAYIKDQPKLFGDICHSCGGCMYVCPVHAISEKNVPIGYIEEGNCDGTTVITGVLNMGEASGVKVIEEALKTGNNKKGDCIIDCPPGSACSVMESIRECDFCLLVAEPTAFGFHNFRMVYELASLLEKPCGVVINKEEKPYEPLDAFCRELDIPILLRIPYEKKVAQLVSEGKLLVKEEKQYRTVFADLFKKIGERIK